MLIVIFVTVPVIVYDQLLSADQGHKAAQNNLGELYLAGRGVEQDYTAAEQWFREAAAQGDSDAQKNLGLIYASGLGVDRDYTEAMDWFQRSAKQGNAAAQANVGHMFRTGDGVGRDYLMAYAWYGVAAAGGYRGAPQFRDSVAQYLTSGELRAGRDLARELFIKYGSK